MALEEDEGRKQGEKWRKRVVIVGIVPRSLHLIRRARLLLGRKERRTEKGRQGASSGGGREGQHQSAKEQRSRVSKRVAEWEAGPDRFQVRGVAI